MATIEKRGKKWSVRYWTEDQYGKKVQKRKSGFATKGEAMAAAQGLEQASAQGIDIHAGQITLGELLERWYKDIYPTVKQTTAAMYSANIDRIKKLSINGQKIASLRPGSRPALMSDMIQAGYAPSTAKLAVSTVSIAMSWAVKMGLVVTNTFVGKTPQVDRRDHVILGDDDIRLLTSACRDIRPSFYGPLLMGLYGGLRAGEVQALTLDDFDFVRKTVSIKRTFAMGHMQDPKTRTSRRTISLPDFVLDYVKTMQTHRTGVLFAHKNYAQYLCELIDKTNEQHPDHQLPHMRYHDLRHTHAAMCIRMGIHAKVISERLGHASISITMDTYGYLMPGMQEACAEQIGKLYG